MWGFGIGLVLPLIPWGLNRFYPNPNWHLVNLPVLTFAGSPGQIQSYVLPVFIVGFISQYYIFRHNKEWFDKYNYVLAVALDSGMAIATLCATIVSAWWVPNSIVAPDGPSDYYCHGGGWEKEQK